MGREAGDPAASPEDRPFTGKSLINDRGGGRAAIRGKESQCCSQLRGPGANQDRDGMEGLRVLPHPPDGVARVAERRERPVAACRVGHIEPARPGIVALRRDEEANRRLAAHGRSCQQQEGGQHGHPERNSIRSVLTDHDSFSNRRAPTGSKDERGPTASGRRLCGLLPRGPSCPPRATDPKHIACDISDPKEVTRRLVGLTPRAMFDPPYGQIAPLVVCRVGRGLSEAHQSARLLYTWASSRPAAFANVTSLWMNQDPDRR